MRPIRMLFFSKSVSPKRFIWTWLLRRDVSVEYFHKDFQDGHQIFSTAFVFKSVASPLVPSFCESIVRFCFHIPVPLVSQNPYD